MKPFRKCVISPKIKLIEASNIANIHPVNHKTPTVSIIIPTYNQAQYLGRTIESVLAQSFKDYEIIVINDSSTDTTAQVLKTYPDERIRIKTMPTNLGPAVTRNVGLEMAQGEFIAFLDSDDLWYPEMLLTMIAYFKGHPGTDIVFGAYHYINEAGQRIGSTGYPSKFRPKPGADLLPVLVVLGNIVHMSASMVRYRCFETYGSFDPSLKRSMDWELWIRMAANNCKIDMIDTVVACYRRHTSNITRVPHQMEKAARQVLDKVFSDEALAVRLAGLEHHAYIDAWLRIAELSFEAGLNSETHKYTVRAEELYRNAPRNIELSLRYLEILFRLPQTENFIQLILDSVPQTEALYKWLLLKKQLKQNQYSQAISNLLLLLVQEPTWFINKTTKRLGREKRQRLEF